MASKQYVDSIGYISEGFMNTVITTSNMLANETELLNGTTPLNLNGQLLTGIGDIATTYTAADVVPLGICDNRYMLKEVTVDLV